MCVRQGVRGVDDHVHEPAVELSDGHRRAELVVVVRAVRHPVEHDIRRAHDTTLCGCVSDKGSGASMTTSMNKPSTAPMAIDEPNSWLSCVLSDTPSNTTSEEHTTRRSADVCQTRGPGRR